MKKEHKKKLLVASLMMTGAASMLTGCREYKKFEKRAAYEVDENGYNRITGFVSDDDLKYIRIYENEERNCIYFAFYDFDFIVVGLKINSYDIFSNTYFDWGQNDICTLEDYVIEKGYKIKKQYTEEDLINLYNECLKDYIEKRKKEIKEEEKSLELIEENKK